jgi:hypothetical protein
MMTFSAWESAAWLKVVPEDAARSAGGDVALEDMQVGAADRGAYDPHDGVSRGGEFRHRPLVERLRAGSVIYECLHRNPPFTRLLDRR